MKTLLLADDDRDLELLVRTMFKGRGYRIEAVYDGADALELLEERDYAVVLLDLMMPKMGGVDVLSRLVSRSPDAAKRVIVLTAADPRTISSFDHSLVGGIIVKPFDVENMRSLVEKVANGG